MDRHNSQVHASPDFMAASTSSAAPTHWLPPSPSGESVPRREKESEGLPQIGDDGSTDESRLDSQVFCSFSSGSVESVPQAIAELRWWQQEDGTVTGPFSFAVLQERAEAGALDPTDLLCPEEETEKWVPAGTMPTLFPQWKLVAAHGRRVGRWSAGVSVALLALFVAANYPDHFSDVEFWMGWLCIALFGGSVGYGVGNAFGAVIGKLAAKRDVAKAVTTTATVAFFLLCLGMTTVYLSGIWRENRRRNQEIQERLDDARNNPPGANARQ